MMSSLFCTYGLEVMLRVSFLWVYWHVAAPWLNGWLIYQMLQTVFCSWSKFSGDMNCPSSPSTTKQQLFPPSVVLKLMTPVMCSFTNMPCDLIMIQALTHFLYECCPFIHSVMCHTKNFCFYFLFILLLCIMVLKMEQVISSLKWMRMEKDLLMTEMLLKCLSVYLFCKRHCLADESRLSVVLVWH